MRVNSVDLYQAPSSPPTETATAEEALSWYKSQYEQLEIELADFRESSRELELELEKDIEQAEKRERALQEKAESLNYEVDEWKRKYRESKAEASAAQNTLEKEITTLRDSNRTLQLKLRDTEVANDDFERQARNTTSSLEDLESKYNVAIERGVMLEEEIRMGEQEREKLRIEAQRLKEELSDLKIEVEVLQDKVRKQESRHLSMISTDISRARPHLHPARYRLAIPEKARPSAAIAAYVGRIRTLAQASSLAHQDAGALDAKEDPSPLGRQQRYSQASTLQLFLICYQAPHHPGCHRHPAATKTPANRTTAPRSTSHRLPATNSLSHIRSLTAQVQRLEARVQSARQRRHHPNQPQAARKTTQTTGKHIPRLSTSGVSRLSFGPLPNRHPAGDSEASLSRPSSRASISSGYARPASRTEMNPPPRPLSRTSLSGTRTPLGRPRSSLGGSLHGHSASMGRFDTDEFDDDSDLRTPSRRGTFSKYEMEAVTSRIPAPASSRRQSGGRRVSSGLGFRESEPLDEMEETY
ncbi:unnamed protein product [Parascedosporium putredinis]|uniref:NUDE domain-containing protein n=1 Tax=Parascedosporium putredinis TaxID=1442378 RepID=A0A9P1HA63_9PEZI|nr:unnamed protein product [Parascedosporium putredinis]CAI8001065.1 unnamed protein product [Parascedosporium putredinis]